jgi:hypothetical protein
VTLTIDIAPDVVNRLQELAMRRGLPVAEYAKAVLEREAFHARAPEERPLHETLTPDEWADTFLQWAASHRTDTRPVPLEALRRESLYEDRGA